MSFQAMTWATEQSLPCNQKMVLLMLANRTNQDTGRCDPSHKRLAEDCGLGPTAVKSAISKLADAGYITIHRRKSGDVNLPNQYTLHIGGSGSRGDRGVGREATEGVGREATTNQEVNNQEVKPMGGSGEPEPTKATSKTKRATPIPDDFCPNDNNHRVAAENNVSIHDELPQFCDHHAAKGSTMKDWNRAFNTWLRNARRFKGGSPTPQGPRKELRLD